MGRGKRFIVGVVGNEAEREEAVEVVVEAPLYVLDGMVDEMRR